jgi:hypothetical protein
MDQSEDSAEGLVGIQRRCVYLDGVRRGLQGRHWAIGILRVSVADFRFHLGGIGGDTARRKFQKAPAGTFGDTRGDEKLYLGVRENHRADISPIQHRALGCAEASLEIKQGRAHRGDGRDLTGSHVSQGPAQITARKVFGGQRACLCFRDAGILRVYATIKHAPANRAVEQAGIEVRQAKLGSQAPGERALARGGGAINGNDGTGG